MGRVIGEILAPGCEVELGQRVDGWGLIAKGRGLAGERRLGHVHSVEFSGQELVVAGVSVEKLLAASIRVAHSSLDRRGVGAEDAPSACVVKHRFVRWGALSRAVASSDADVWDLRDGAIRERVERLLAVGCRRVGMLESDGEVRPLC